MKLCSGFFLILICLVGLNAHATTDWRENSVLIEQGTDLQAQIDDVTIEIFQSLKNTFCAVYLNATSAQYSLGISAGAALRIYSSCPQSLPGNPTKVFPKQYYISFVKMDGLDSWTDYGNRTFIFEPETLNRSKLKSIILHEMAISTDGKTNMLFPGYLAYRAKEHSEVIGGTQVITIDGLSKSEELLQQAFNWATWKSASMTFAALRAFNLELYLDRKKLLIESHSDCVLGFKSLLSQIKKFPATPKSSEIDGMAEAISELTSNKWTPTSTQQELKVIELLMSPGLQLQDVQGKTMSFCQFMAYPYLVGRSTYNFLATGPRPRLTGGSGGQGMKLEGWGQELERSHSIDGGIDNQKIKDAIQRLKDLSRDKKVNIAMVKE